MVYGLFLCNKVSWISSYKIFYCLFYLFRRIIQIYRSIYRDWLICCHHIFQLVSNFCNTTLQLYHAHYLVTI